jgi:hypothetical protein
MRDTVGLLTNHCSHDGCVHHRYLADMNLTGTLPGSLANFSQLTGLYVWAAQGGGE